MILICIFLIISDVEHLFHVPVGHLSVFFGKTSIQHLCPFKKKIELCFFIVELYEFFIYFEYQALIRYTIFKYLLPFCRLSFHFCWWFPLLCKSFLVSFIFALVSLACGDISRKIMLQSTWRRIPYSFCLRVLWFQVRCYQTVKWNRGWDGQI